MSKYSNFKEEHEEYFRAVFIHLFENHNTLNIFQIYSTELGNFMCQYRNGLLPLLFDHVLTELESNYRHKTNFRHKIHKIKTIFFHRAKNIALSKKLFLHTYKKKMGWYFIISFLSRITKYNAC